MLNKTKFNWEQLQEILNSAFITIKNISTVALFVTIQHSPNIFGTSKKNPTKPKSEMVLLRTVPSYLDITKNLFAMPPQRIRSIIVPQHRRAT